MNTTNLEPTASSKNGGGVDVNPPGEFADPSSRRPAADRLKHLLVESDVSGRDIRSVLLRQKPGNDVSGNPRSISMPKIVRVSMAPRPFDRHPLRRLWGKLRVGGPKLKNTEDREGKPVDRVSRAPWHKLAVRRRVLLSLLVITQTAIATGSLARTFPWPHLDPLEMTILAFFAVLFSWISFAFWTNVAGFFILWRKGKIIAPQVTLDEPLRARTALLMPICNEEVGRCFNGLEVMYRSLVETGELGKFDFYILSDTSDPEHQLEEEAECARLCRAVSGFGKIFYRRRRVNIKRKSGNIADFLRRWSRNYEFMIVLDADSLMTGAAIVHLARLMERSPQAGIIQTTPTIVNSASLFARMQQFASRTYGPLFSASLDYWQLGESYYWGHNAIIRVAPFVKYCALARLPGRPPLGGEILSHDFVEAALMGRAGKEVWLTLDLPGSYEESPPNLLDELKRDRRWCQGNLQHLRLLLGDRLKTGHRAILAMGVMAYASALFWAGFLVLNTTWLAAQAYSSPSYFSSQPSLFPVWPRWHPEWAIALASTTALLLILPKVLSFLLIVKRRQAKYFGGSTRLALSIGLEIVLSTLLAPLRMWFHSKFVLLTLFGRPIKWNAQQRTANRTTWSEAFRAYGIATFFASCWIAGISWLDPGVFVWLLPVAIPLLLSMPLAVFSSSVSLGEAIKRWGILLIPEESSPPHVLAELKTAMDSRESEQVSVSASERARTRLPRSRPGDLPSWSPETIQKQREPGSI